MHFGRSASLQLPTRYNVSHSKASRSTSSFIGIRGPLRLGSKRVCKYRVSGEGWRSVKRTKGRVYKERFFFNIRFFFIRANV